MSFFIHCPTMTQSMVYSISIWIFSITGLGWLVCPETQYCSNRNNWAMAFLGNIIVTAAISIIWFRTGYISCEQLNSSYDEIEIQSQEIEIQPLESKNINL